MACITPSEERNLRRQSQDRLVGGYRGPSDGRQSAGVFVFSNRVAPRVGCTGQNSRGQCFEKSRHVVFDHNDLWLNACSRSRTRLHEPHLGGGTTCSHRMRCVGPLYANIAYALAYCSTLCLTGKNR